MENTRMPMKMKQWLLLTTVLFTLVPCFAMAARMDTLGVLLMDAAASGQLDKIRSLLDKGVDVNGMDLHGRTPLMQAAVAGHAGTVRLLIQRGADVNRRNHYGRTALMDAVQTGRLQVVRLLLENRSDVNAKGISWTYMREVLRAQSVHEVSEILD
jgi:ankyrin repeat protein